MQKPTYLLLALFATCLIVAGCGSSGGGTDTTSTVSIADAARTNDCTICHSIETHTVFDGIAGVNTDAGGLGSAITHDCEDCHGGGQYHHGIGPLPYPSPDGERCATCHVSQGTKILASAHNGGDETNVAMLASGHDSGVCQRCHTAEGFQALKSINGEEADFDNGIVDYGTTPGVGQLAALNHLDADGNHILHNLVCGTCHNPLTKEMNTADPAWTPNGSTSAQLALCTSCHGYKLNDGTLLATGNTYTVSTGAGADSEFFTADDTLSAGTATGVVGHHDTSWYRIIASTHYDNPDSTVGNSGVIEGYVIRENSETACFDCHGHELMTNTRRHATTGETIHSQWAASAHAGHLLKAKDAAAAANPVTGARGSAENTATGHAQVEAVLAVGVTDETGAGWSHYNWDQVTGTGNRAGCQRCHTATGAKNFMTSPATYDATANDFSHLSGWTAATGSPQNELLYCWACHSDAEAGTLRNPGAITEEYDPAVIVSYPDVAGSNVCMSCHLGRETGAVIKADADTDGIRSFINSHYLSAGGQLFGETGYEYDGQNYANVAYFAHDAIGTAAEPGTGSNGPCVGCHMSSTDNSHSFLPVTKDEATDEITAITSTVCISCHNGTHVLTAADLTTEEEDYAASLAALQAALDAKGIYFSSGYPYFFQGPGGTGGSYTNWAGPYGLALWKDTMGAAFNLNLLLHDPGGYAHNRYYVKRLIWDSIDFIDDGTLNNSVVATIQALETATSITAAQSAAAQTYLGTARP